ncbi:MAG: Methionine--tRNA ligase [Candidatus Moanabacter tarae]|mgnify:CR=1 FL=1|uniref:Methionine--tRNA ligase n=1 Tax=Candidatus Moanibacter tarae TaxID=2200854 RepID=A0A2Z4AMT3_9BACT|nr:MAG: Methionine--tRNA ligase [Candidatus Moanabacter tarae]|tara:strand:+ start:9586 stop:11109 length:1524 start_codon:yes stop_codon:yes gene_type:complete
MGKFYITTAIDYANGPPHLGHAYEKVLADVVARLRRLKGDQVRFLTGLDEHGQKVQQSAKKEGIDPKVFVDSIAEKFQKLLIDLNISNDDYIRTTEERHKTVVRDILQRLFDEGEIYKGEYSGFYSVRAEQFVQETEKEGNKWPEDYGEVIKITEANYFFRLSKYRAWLIEYIQDHEDLIYPRFRAKQVLEFLKEPINDLCISRPKERLGWGIPLPFDDEYVAYVWFDALINYLSAVDSSASHLRDFWPANFHVIGKDILVPPHAIYWPIMLKAAGYEPPRGFLVHGFWTTAGKKMSKSTGETVDPLDLINQYGADVFRYFVTREMTVGQDSEFSLELFVTRYTSDLANDLGNLVSRLLNMVHQYRDGVLPSGRFTEQPEENLRESWKKTNWNVVSLFEEFRFNNGLAETFNFIRSINRYAEIRAPWKLAKSSKSGDVGSVDTTLAHMAEGLRLAVCLLAPVMPVTSAKILALLGQPEVSSWQEGLDWSNRLEGKRVKKKTILFPRI